MKLIIILLIFLVIPISVYSATIDQLTCADDGTIYLEASDFRPESKTVTVKQVATGKTASPKLTWDLGNSYTKNSQLYYNAKFTYAGLVSEIGLFQDPGDYSIIITGATKNVFCKGIDLNCKLVNLSIKNCYKKGLTHYIDFFANVSESYDMKNKFSNDFKVNLYATSKYLDTTNFFANKGSFPKNTTIEVKKNKMFKLVMTFESDVNISEFFIRVNKCTNTSLPVISNIECTNQEPEDLTLLEEGNLIFNDQCKTWSPCNLDKNTKQICKDDQFCKSTYCTRRCKVIGESHINYIKTKNEFMGDLLVNDMLKISGKEIKLLALYPDIEAVNKKPTSKLLMNNEEVIVVQGIPKNVDGIEFTMYGYVNNNEQKGANFYIIPKEAGSLQSFTEITEKITSNKEEVASKGSEIAQEKKENVFAKIISFITGIFS